MESSYGPYPLLVFHKYNYQIGARQVVGVAVLGVA